MPDNGPVQILLRSLLVLAYLVLALGIVVLCLGLIGVQLSQQVRLLLTVPMFVISVPAILVGRRLTSPFTEREVRKSHWKLLLRGCPPWARKVVAVSGWGAMLTFVLLVFAPASHRDAFAMRFLFPIYGMFFATYATAIFYSALHVGDERRQCSKGHDVSPMQSYCPECGENLSAGSGQAQKN